MWLQIMFFSGLRKEAESSLPEQSNLGTCKSNVNLAWRPKKKTRKRWHTGSTIEPGEREQKPEATRDRDNSEDRRVKWQAQKDNRNNRPRLKWAQNLPEGNRDRGHYWGQHLRETQSGLQSLWDLRNIPEPSNCPPPGLRVTCTLWR